MHEFIEIGGMKILVTDDATFTKSKRYKQHRLYMCYVKEGGKWAKIDVPVETFEDEEVKKHIPHMLREKLNSITDVPRTK